ncbi:TetR family transcriptional regulator [Paenibacillus qinlingensis]|uniref:AcrR family transcriptional regulator n=1 Tax=Paenibacillus qinlingensis TaxID=1837343 RepID=A0ABU1NXB3_9BACL|nr:TetR family transcriptional regulator [Paenibacillus qinlingensis]MDR6551929.1 AcrR family transcriptional regulator [Paenibacillus qinlingensis]
MGHQESDMKMKIVLAAKKLFAKHGYDATSVRQICEEAGANVALVSYYFGGKESVFHEVFKQYFPSNELRDFYGIDDPYLGIQMVIREVLKIRTEDPELISIIQMEIITITPRVDKMREIFFPLWQKVRDLLDKGRQDGVYEFESLDSTLMFVLGAMFFYKQREFFEPIFTEERPDMETLIGQTTAFIMRALGYNK